MATLTALPHMDIINGFKGTVDFYVYRGTPCARSWPRSPGHTRSPAVTAQWPAFAYAVQTWNSLSPYVQEAYRLTSASTHMSGRDLYVKSFLSDYFREGQWD